MIYHPMKIHQLHINMKPNDGHQPTGESKKKNVDRWHCDSTPFVLVVFCTDPDQYTGGTLEYFNGTREEGTELLSAGVEERRSFDRRVLNVGRQKKGYGVFMQGWRVFHQVTPVLSGDERTTIVFSFHPRNVLSLEACKHFRLTYDPVDPLHVIMPDWVRYRAWKVMRRLEIMLEHWGEHDHTTVSACHETDIEELLPAVRCSLAKLANIVEHLPYTDERNEMACLLNEAILDVREFVYLHDLLEDTTAAAGDPTNNNEKLSPPSEIIEPSTSSPSHEEKRGSLSGHCTHHLNLSGEFMQSPYGLANLLGALDDVDNCTQDILTLKERESSIVYF